MPGRIFASMKELKALILALSAILAITVATGCASTRIDWNTRIGIYTFDDAIRELGPPDKSAQLTDGSTVADWVTSRGTRMSTAYVGGWYPYGPYGWGGPNYVFVEPPGPDRVLRLTFDPQGRLASWTRVYQ
jgi:hypothetical protein